MKNEDVKGGMDMIRRTIDFTAKADGGVTPAIPVFGGVKGEHNATQIRITLDSGIYEDGDPVRLCFTTGDGTVLSSDLLDDMEVQGDKVVLTYTLGELLTVAAHQLCVRVVISRLNDSGNETQRWRSGEMVLYFETSSVENGTPFWTGVSEMLVRTVSAKDDALSAKDTALTAAARAEAVANTAAQSAVDAAGAAQAAVTAAVVVLNDEIETIRTDTGDMKACLEEVEDSLTQIENVQSDLAGMAVQQSMDLAALKNTTLKYKGSTASGTQLSVVDKAVGDVWYVGNEQAFFMWDGESWKRLGSSGSYTLTASDKQEIAALCQTLIADGNEVAY